ncbi:uncharacterized protein LOC130940167 isoform X2 [Arachis stenosperma]|uniref:uncharacterized protein LOC130940167 isoform X2 n=1 Tax=Arachis stenosperma TaxID=217475 RepID=UPI0025ABAB6C|nr:uncharacterized protein LOC130940167 isoform X2 [Arachis stenosperma]XP_057724212.1 uncharacterized protein LOC130940167 isoform X2 [Arachis stenosperma]
MEESYTTGLPTSHLAGSVMAVTTREKSTTKQDETCIVEEPQKKLVMSASEKPSSSSSVTSTVALARDIDPLLKDLNEKKQSFKRNVVSLAAELKDIQNRLASQEQSYAKETLTRKEAETKAKSMEFEIGRLQKKLEERNEHLPIALRDIKQHDITQSMCGILVDWIVEICIM